MNKKNFALKLVDEIILHLVVLQTVLFLLINLCEIDNLNTQFF